VYVGHRRYVAGCIAFRLRSNPLLAGDGIDPVSTGIRHSPVNQVCRVNQSGIDTRWYGSGVFFRKKYQSGPGQYFSVAVWICLANAGFYAVFMRLLERLSGRLLGILGRLPARMVSAEISRTGIAIAALMIALRRR